MNFHHYEKGWHPTATLGVFGAAAASARLMRLSDAQTARALAIAVSLASGVKANFGTMTKPLHVGHCARNALFAALLAKEDFTANSGAFEHEEGFFNVFNGPDTFDAERIFAEWAQPFDIEARYRYQALPVLRQRACIYRRHDSLTAGYEIDLPAASGTNVFVLRPIDEITSLG